MNVICFHNPDEENGYMSNWYPSVFMFGSVEFSSMEQYMMYRKAVCFGDEVIAAQILATNDVAEIKALGRLVLGYDDNWWNGVRQIVGKIFPKCGFTEAIERNREGCPC